jgi:hypothetical protein
MMATRDLPRVGQVIVLPEIPHEGIPEETLQVEAIEYGFLYGRVPERFRESWDRDGVREIPLGYLGRWVEWKEH